MTNTTDYIPPKVWTWEKPNGGEFASINRPTAGAREERELPIGKHPLQLYSMGTPNGVKVTIMLEELLEAGHSGAKPYAKNRAGQTPLDVALSKGHMGNMSSPS